ncbi:MAG: hypothetical protein AAF617_05505 [Bacteroidota bacterium]
MQSQTADIAKVFFDIVDLEATNKSSTIGYTKKVHIGMLTNDVDSCFAKQTSLTYTMYQRHTKRTDSIVLSVLEKQHLLIELRASKNFEWNLPINTKLEVIKDDEPLYIQNYLRKDKNRVLKIISKPIFIRNNTIACVFSADLCCGHIFGHTSLSFYKPIQGKWTEWIVICQGDF